MAVQHPQFEVGLLLDLIDHNIEVSGYIIINI